MSPVTEEGHCNNLRSCTRLETAKGQHGYTQSVVLPCEKTRLVFSVTLDTSCTTGSGPVRNPIRIPALTILLKESKRTTRPVSRFTSRSNDK